MKLPTAVLLAAVIVLAAIPARAQWDAGGPAPMQPAQDPPPPTRAAAPQANAPNAAATAVAPTPEPEPIDVDVPTLLHESPATFERGQPLRLDVTALDHSGVATVTVHYRPGRAKAYASLEMVMDERGHYKASVLPAAMAEPWLDYYVEAFDLKGNGPARLGSPEDPMRLRSYLAAAAPVTTAGGPTRLALVFAAASVLGIGVLRLRDRHARGRAADHVFWTRTLLPLLGLHGPAFTKAVTELSERPLWHPVYGERQFSRTQILARVDRIKQIRLDQLIERVEKYDANRLVDPPRPEPSQAAAPGAVPGVQAVPPVLLAPARARRELTLVAGSTHREGQG